jgi:hypothetical protein
MGGTVIRIRSLSALALLLAISGSVFALNTGTSDAKDQAQASAQVADKAVVLPNDNEQV